jgi:penicillin-binding protein 1A
MEQPVQAVLDHAFQSKGLFQTKPAQLAAYPEKPNGSCVVINVKTGAISAMAGGYGEKTMNLTLNRAVSTYRNPGSSIKPLIDYGPALELGIIAPGTIVNDRKVYLDPNNPKKAWPVNYERNYTGQMTIRQALAKSRNTIAAEVWTKVGGQTALWYLKQVGIDRTSEGAYPSQSLGGFSKGMTTLEMAAAYATFASGGTYTAPYAYTKVLDSEGKLVIEAKPMKYRVYSKETCFLLTDILKDVVTSGWVRHYGGQIKNSKGKQIDAAGKTGTTSDNNDKWFCGFTTYYAAAVWYGYDNRLKQTTIPKTDYFNAGRIWEYCMQNIHKDLPASSFKKPANVVKVSYCTKSGMYPNAECKEAKTVKSDYFVKGSYLYPKEDKPCKVHATPTPGPTPPPNPEE